MHWPAPEALNTIAWLVIAITNLVTAYISWRTHGISLATQANVAIVEKATNNMKDTLVISTAKASYAEGHDAASKDAAQAMITAKAVAAADEGPGFDRGHQEN